MLGRSTEAKADLKKTAKTKVAIPNILIKYPAIVVFSCKSGTCNKVSHFDPFFPPIISIHYFRNALPKYLDKNVLRDESDFFIKSTLCESNEAKKSTFPRRMRRREKNLDKTSVGLYSSD